MEMHNHAWTEEPGEYICYIGKCSKCKKDLYENSDFWHEEGTYASHIHDTVFTCNKCHSKEKTMNSVTITYKAIDGPGVCFGWVADRIKLACNENVIKWKQETCNFKISERGQTGIVMIDNCKMNTLEEFAAGIKRDIENSLTLADLTVIVAKVI